MNIKQTLILTCLTLVMAGNLNAQDKPTTTVDFFDTNITDYNFCGCDYTLVQVAVSRVGVTYSYSTANGSRISHSLNYAHHDQGFKGYFDLGDKDELTLHNNTFEYALSATHLLSDTWSVTGNISPQFRSYLDEDGTDFYTDVEGKVLFSYQYSQNLVIGGGVAYTRNLGEKLLHPLLQVNYDNHKNMRANLYFPEIAEVWYDASSKMSFGLKATLMGEEFKGVANDVWNSKTTIQYADFTVGPAMEYHFSQYVSLNLQLGYTAGRHFVIEDEDSRDRIKPTPNYTFKTGFKVTF